MGIQEGALDKLLNLEISKFLNYFNDNGIKTTRGKEFMHVKKEIL